MKKLNCEIKKQRQRQRNKLYREDPINRIRMKNYLNIYRNKTENKQKNIEYQKVWYQEKNRERHIILATIWNRNNPRSMPNGSVELQEAMNNVRIRDKNTCQWYGCGLKHKATTIDVHHIFPRSEYPELELVEQYMICYCKEHHAQFHAARGDWYHNVISKRKRMEIEIYYIRELGVQKGE